MDTRMKLKSKRQLDAHREADRAVLLQRMRRAGITAPSPEEIETFAVGGCGCDGGTASAIGRAGLGSCSPQQSMCRPSSINDCYHKIAERFSCPLKVCPGSRLNVDGQTIISIQVEPTQSQYFLPVYVRFRGRDHTAVDTSRIWWVTAVQINGVPQETYNTTAPTAAVTSYVESVGYQNKTAGDVPGYEVAWGAFSKQALGNSLVITGWQPIAAGTFVDAGVEIWGYPIDFLPDGWKCGLHPTAPMPNTPSA